MHLRPGRVKSFKVAIRPNCLVIFSKGIPSGKTISMSGDINYKYKPEITTRTVHSRLFYENHEFANKLKVTKEAFPTYVPNARVHTFHRFIPEEKFYKEHPEYFALRGDKRLPTQLCLTNDDVYSIVKDSVTSLFAKNPMASIRRSKTE